MGMVSLLIICTGNSCRSQMAEGWVTALASDLPDYLQVATSSAGLEAHGLNQHAVAAMARQGVDISQHQSKLLSDQLLQQADLVVSVCGHADNHCPPLPAGVDKLHIPFDDPAGASGSPEQVEAVFDRVAGQIKQAMQELLDSLLLNYLQEHGGEVFDATDVRIEVRKNLHQGFVPIDVLQLQHRLFSGGWSDTVRREMADRPEAVGVLLYDPDVDRVVMIRQFRVGALGICQSPWLLEIVAGLSDAGEAAEDVVKREALEEANCKVTELITVHEYLNSPGWSNEKITLFCGRVNAADVRGIHGLDVEHEDILVVSLTFEDAMASVASGSINNAMSIIALQWLQLNREKVRNRWLKVDA